jgi:hypothetical protein
MNGSIAGVNMEKVTGIGGVFFRARDPAALSQWYQEHLGVAPTPSSYEELPWRQEAGPTVFAPFPEGTEYFGDPKRSWMVNFRVRNLDAMRFAILQHVVMSSHALRPMWYKITLRLQSFL